MKAQLSTGFDLPSLAAPTTPGEVSDMETMGRYARTLLGLVGAALTGLLLGATLVALVFAGALVVGFAGGVDASVPGIVATTAGTADGLHALEFAPDAAGMRAIALAIAGAWTLAYALRRMTPGPGGGRRRAGGHSRLRISSMNFFFGRAPAKVCTSSPPLNTWNAGIARMP